MKITKKVLKYPCYCCHVSIKGKTVKRKSCAVCNGTGKFTDEIYYFIYIGKDGKKYAIDSDNLS
jgi:hypothetical protein